MVPLENSVARHMLLKSNKEKSLNGNKARKTNLKSYDVLLPCQLSVLLYF